MIDLLKGHPCTYSDDELRRMDDISKKNFLEGTEIISNDEIESDDSLELSIKEAIRELHKIRFGAEIKSEKG